MIAVSVPQGGIVFDEKTGAPKVLKNAMENYMESKVGNVFLASEAARRLGGDGIISLVSDLFTSLLHVPVKVGLCLTTFFSEREPWTYENRAAETWSRDSARHHGLPFPFRPLKPLGLY